MCVCVCVCVCGDGAGGEVGGGGGGGGELGRSVSRVGGKEIAPCHDKSYDARFKALASFKKFFF